ncbi:replicative DNA helicase [uncultured Caudovirales phage]|uniref:Replicative DNA helicase n=1 Tax=uncultured Caudovirales phage TaxID=2100421 RepID=A0A6J5L7C7_9CAUD|nr:replicative DNA helicase [uncultured Caudovirales phage]
MIDSGRIKEQADIVRVIGSFVNLKNAGAGELAGLCPFHKEGTPSFTVTPSKQIFHCFGCKASGDVFSFVKRIEGLATFDAAVRRVAEIVGADVMVQPVQREQRQRAKPVDGPQTQGRVVATYSYTDEHGELLYEVQRVEPGRDGRAKDFRQRRPHPIDDGAWVWGIKDGAYRKGQGGDWYPVKGVAGPDDDELPEVRRVLFRLPVVLQADTVYVVEGEKDVLTLEKAGLVATTNSGGASQKWLDEYSEAFRGRRVVVIPDNDEPGKKRGAVISKALAGIAAEVLLIELPGAKDATEFVESGHPASEIEELVEATRRKARSEEVERRGLLSPVEIVQNFDGGLNAFLDPSKRAPGLKTGFQRFDEMTLGLHGGELVILAARPAQGKTALAMNIATNIAERGDPVAIFSLEMSRESLLTRIVCARGRIDQLKFRSGFLNSDERAKLSRAFREVCELPIFIDDNADASLKSFRRKLVELRSARGLGLVIIDYLQLMGSANNGGRDNRTQEVGALSRGLKLMAREFKTPFLVLSQLSRATETRVGNHRPQLSDLRESGGIEQDADLVAFIFREEVYKPDRDDLRGLAELIIAKQRNGPTGKVNLVFLHSLTKFESRAREEEAA